MKYKLKELNYKDIKAIKVYLELKSNRLYVGKLFYNSGEYNFEYYKKYITLKKAIPIGPELPLTRLKFTSNQLFSSFEDRIPSKENPAYSEYCKVFNLDSNEDNKLVLLATIGRKGPSSLIFEPDWGMTFSAADLKNYRIRLGLSTRDFAECFGFTQAAIVRVEQGKSSGKEILKFVEMLFKFPEAALYLVLKEASKLHSKRKSKVVNLLEEEIALTTVTNNLD